MTKRDFFVLLIKVFGLFSAVRTLFSVLPNNFSLALRNPDAASFIWMITAAVIVIGLFVLLIFKSAWVARVLKLDQGFDEDRIELGNFKGNDILRISSIVIGGILIINNVPPFLGYTFFGISNFGHPEWQKFYWIVTGANILIGFLLVIYYETVARLLSSRTKEEEKEEN